MSVSESKVSVRPSYDSIISRPKTLEGFVLVAGLAGFKVTRWM